MRKIVMVAATAASFVVISLVALNNAEARFGAGMIAEASADGSIAQPAQYYGGYEVWLLPAILRAALLWLQKQSGCFGHVRLLLIAGEGRLVFYSAPRVFRVVSLLNAAAFTHCVKTNVATCQAN